MPNPREAGSGDGRPNFGGLVLGCINADICVQILIFQILNHFSSFFEIYNILKSDFQKSTDFVVLSFSFSK